LVELVSSYKNPEITKFFSRFQNPDHIPSTSFTIQFASDLHIEYGHPFGPLIKPSSPYLALAGDIGVVGKAQQYADFLLSLTPHFKAIFVVPGNHEFYTSEWEHAFLIMSQVCSMHPKLIFMNKTTYKIPDSNIRILGSILWSKIPSGSLSTVGKYLTDYHKIYVPKSGVPAVPKLYQADSIQQPPISLSQQENENKQTTTQPQKSCGKKPEDQKIQEEPKLIPKKDNKGKDEKKPEETENNKDETPLKASKQKTTKLIFPTVDYDKDVRNLKPEDTDAVYESELSWLKKEIKKAQTAGDKIVVMTHHGPVVGTGCSNPEYVWKPDENINCAFSSDLSDMMGEVDIWIYGHTHWAHNMCIEGTQLVSNPHGYPPQPETRSTYDSTQDPNNHYDPAAVVKLY